MATQDVGGLVYQSYTPQPSAASTKVLNLSYSQSPQVSPGQQPTQYYAQPSTQQAPQQQTYGAVYAQPASPQAQSYQSPGQPQVFTVGSNPSQQQQQYRVITMPQQSQPGNFAGNQPNVVYLGQQQQSSPSYSPYQQQQQQPQARPEYQQAPGQQSWQVNQQVQQQPFTSPQPSGQVVFAQPASRPVQQSNQPSGSVPYQTQTLMQNGQSGVTVFQTANQHTPAGQPMGVQPVQQQQWASQVQPTPTQVYQQPQQQQYQTRVYSAPSAAQPQAVSVSPQAVQQPRQQTTWTSGVQTTGGYQPQQQYQPTQAYQAPVQPVQQQSYQARPPQAPTQFNAQDVRRRTPSVGGAPRTIKVKSLPMRNSASVDNLDAAGPPQFVQHPVGQINVKEGEPASITAKVRPAGDGSLRVEWYKNGHPLSASSRFSTIFDRGYAVLEFIYTNEDDTADYSCVATNDSGQDQSSPCHVNVIAEEGVITESQLPEESMIANLAAMENQMFENGLARTARYRDEPKSTRPPQFIKALNPQTGIRESAPAHFETIIEPSNDGSLEVEWYKDGKPVNMGCRFNAILDRGFAILDILYCYPEDNGAYWCVAKNSLGQVQSNVVDLQCSPEASIVTNSVLSKESVSYLQSLDNWGSEQMSGYDRPRIEEEEIPTAPSFDIMPVPLTVTEGNPARFLVKAGGYPRPKVQWYLNGELLASAGGGGNWRVYQDGGISHLEFHHVGTPGLFKIVAVARNNMGEATSETQMLIEPQIDFRPDLRHVQPENPFKKLAQLKKVERTNELSTAFNRPRAQALDLRRMERQAEYNARAAADSEALEAENLYARVQAQLRTNRRSSLPPPTPPSAAGLRGPPQPQMQRAQAPEPQMKMQQQPMQRVMNQPAMQPQPRVAQVPLQAPPQPINKPQPPPPPKMAPSQQVMPPPKPQQQFAPPPPPPQQFAPPPQPSQQVMPPPPPPQQFAPPPQQPIVVAAPQPVVATPPPPPAAPPAAPPPDIPPPPPPMQDIPPPPPPVEPFIMSGGMANEIMAPAQQAQTEYLHEEISAEFTIEL